MRLIGCLYEDYYDARSLEHKVNHHYFEIRKTHTNNVTCYSYVRHL